MSQETSLSEEYDKTIGFLEDLKSAKGLPWHIYKQAANSKATLGENHIKKIEAVQRFDGEVSQFKTDVRQAIDAGTKQAAKKISYEEENAIKDMEKAAEAVLHFEEMKRKATRKKDESQEQGDDRMALFRTDSYLMFEAMLRDTAYYFWEGYSTFRVQASELAKKTNNDVFKKEFKKIDNDSVVEQAIDVIGEEYGGPSKLESNRYSGLESNAQKVRDQLN